MHHRGKDGWKRIRLSRGNGKTLKQIYNLSSMLIVCVGGGGGGGLKEPTNFSLPQGVIAIPIMQIADHRLSWKDPRMQSSKSL